LSKGIHLSDKFAVGQLFFFEKFESIENQIHKILFKEGLELKAVRSVPINKDILGNIALDCLPNIYQIF